MLQVGFIKDDKLMFESTPNLKEVVATINHLNNSELAAAKMFLQWRLQ